jgi:xylan 1,4-beta-xylosidase
LSRTPVYIRTHNLLTTGNGVPALKWSSTNAYTEGAAGKPVYDWTIIDKVFDTYLEAGAKPFVEIGFMPEALSIHPQPYQHTWPKGGIDTGWAYPPNSYSKWDQLIYEWVRHCVGKYGRPEVESWCWEVWNEPDISYWHGTPEQYDELYDHTTAAVKHALPSVGPRGRSRLDRACESEGSGVPAPVPPTLRWRPAARFHQLSRQRQT